VRHVHREDGIVKQSISLGVWNEKVHKKWYSDTLKSKISKNHVIHYYGDGDMCDVTGKPRQTRIKFKSV
jgi:endoplasmic reticulum lectin 1